MPCHSTDRSTVAAVGPREPTQEMASLCKLLHPPHQLTNAVQKVGFLSSQTLSTSNPLSAIILLSRLRVVDNSTLGASAVHKPPRCIHVYNKQAVGKVGDKILVAIKGQKKKALIVGVKMPGKNMTPRFDTNNIVLLEESGNPTGTRIRVPIPSYLRGRKDLSKVFAVASTFV